MGWLGLNLVILLVLPPLWLPSSLCVLCWEAASQRWQRSGKLLPAAVFNQCNILGTPCMGSLPLLSCWSHPTSAAQWCFFLIKPFLWKNQAAAEPHVSLLVRAACVASCVPEKKTGGETSSSSNWEFEFYSFSKKVNNRFCQSSPLGIVLFQVENFCFKLTYKMWLFKKYFRYGNSMDPLSPEELQK